MVTKCQNYHNDQFYEKFLKLLKITLLAQNLKQCKMIIKSCFKALIDVIEYYEAYVEVSKPFQEDLNPF